MAQGFKVAHPFHRAGDGLPVDDVPRAEGDRKAKPLPDQTLEHLHLDLPHQLEVDLP